MAIVNPKENPFIPSGSTIEFKDSSNLASVLYYSNGETGVADTLFKSGQWYRYIGVPPALMNAIWQGRATKDGKKLHSKGAAFHQLVISMPNLYPYQKISEGEVGKA